jgi:hypothetical protein
MPQIRLLDVSDPWRMKTIQTYAMTPLGGASQVGPHVIKICEKRGIMAVSTYFVTIPGEQGAGLVWGERGEVLLQGCGPEFVVICLSGIL